MIKKCMQTAAQFALLLLLAANIYAEHSGRFLVSVGTKLAFAAGFVALWTLATYLGARRTDSAERRRKRARRYLTVLFLYYLWILGNMLFFDAAFGRTAGEGIAANLHFYRAGVNLEPLKTIKDYLWALEHDRIRPGIVAVNLLGNLAAFAPMGFFLPALIRPLRNFFVYTLGVTGMVCAVELLQTYTATGSCDIDDVILNTAGALIVWLVVQLPPIRRRAYGVLPSRERKRR